MLPLVQVHQVVQSSPHLDPRTSLQSPNHHNQHRPTPKFSNSAHSWLSPHRVFPIRGSQSASASHLRFSGPIFVPDNHEHHLRRKTPNGTIDAGYDGSPAQLASGPPPLKHMILPGSSSLYPVPPNYDFTAAGASAAWPPRTIGLPTGNLPRSRSLVGSDSNRPPYRSNWQSTRERGSRPTGSLEYNPLTQPLAYYPSAVGPRVPIVTQSNFQQIPGPPVFNNGGLYTFQTWPEMNMHGAEGVAVDAPYNVMRGQPAHPTSPLNSSNLSNLSIGHDARYDMVYGSFQTSAQRLESLSLESSSYDVPVNRFPESPPPTGFRAKALLNAHRAYLELLSYIHMSKKATSSRLPNTSRTSSKMVIFPKLPAPPKPGPPSPSYHGPRVLHSYANSVNDAFTRDSHSSRFHSYGAHDGAGIGLRAGNHELTNAAATTSNIPHYHLFSSEGSGYNDHDLTRTIVAQTPISNANAAAEMLHNLCEQSGWKWVDGMLLGGCLYYGLEKYEHALEWFTRVVAIDDGHIEAISNVAATLYCLQRSDEAEKHWLQAVKRKPSYLEAVEHLVYILSTSHRTKEAVDIINFVQRSLKVQDTATTFHLGTRPGMDGRSAQVAVGREAPSQHPAIAYSHSAEEPGFGSSGYNVAGSENGRIIALIHAKGNLLYSLKDIERASEAFEEAVLISAGRDVQCVRSLINRIRSVLSTSNTRVVFPPDMPVLTGPLLLPPEKAKYTAQLVFKANGDLPGLRFVSHGAPKKSAISITSNALLSLAKIFQDGMAHSSSMAGPLQHPPGVDDILALYYLSLSLSESPSTANNVGILLASVQQSASIQTQSAAEGTSNPPISGIAPGSGLDLALAYYKYGLTLDPKHVHLHTNLGSLLKDIGHLDLAIQMYEQAVACDGTFDIALTNLANAVKDRGRINDAIMYYKRAVQSNPEFAEAVCGLSTALNSVCDWRDRGGVILHGTKFDRWHVDDNGMLLDARNQGVASGLTKRVVDIVSKQLMDSSLWGSGILQNSTLESIAAQLRAAGAHKTDKSLNLELELQKWAGRPWEGSRILRLIERSTKAGTRLWYQEKYIDNRPPKIGYPRPRPPGSLAIPSAPTVLPFHTFTCPLTAKDIRKISQRNALRISCSTLRSPWLPSTVFPPPPPPHPHLNIGYVSSDFNNHPLAHLMQSVFGMHNQSRARAFCYATTASDKSSHREQIEREAPVFHDVSTWPTERLVNQIVHDEIHILVNLNGYTRGARNEVFAARPAPIQMSFMGFAGTLGAEWCDYLLADEIAVPRTTLRPNRSNLNLADVFQDEEVSEDADWVYSENIIFCKDTFFCCDHAQSSGPEERLVTWQDEQQRRWKMRKELFPNLSDDTIILGNFNQLYKIDPSTFRSWLRILSNVPKAVLWLLRFPELGENNLKRTAKLWASEEVASRIIFTDVAPKQQHISRARVCDLFLDTPECNAHTTAADVLWSSTPLLTLPRYPYKMCSRMAASILKSALPRTDHGASVGRDLIAEDEDDYEAIATRLAGGLSYRLSNGQFGEGQGRLAEMRKILFDSKWSCPLFDTRRWVSDLEAAYEEAWRRWVVGEDGDIYL
ncbi:glycosyl transferase family 41-domain-containing protein [Xylariales sp. PMI_506]|nr:glycosyl transferase family 41-domain-containing protein [Xylariales sp. PMI_506]